MHVLLGALTDEVQRVGRPPTAVAHVGHEQVDVGIPGIADVIDERDLAAQVRNVAPVAIQEYPGRFVARWRRVVGRV